MPVPAPIAAAPICFKALHHPVHVRSQLDGKGTHGPADRHLSPWVQRRGQICNRRATEPNLYLSADPGFRYAREKSDVVTVAEHLAL